MREKSRGGEGVKMDGNDGMRARGWGKRVLGGWL